MYALSLKFPKLKIDFITYNYIPINNINNNNNINNKNINNNNNLPKIPPKNYDIEFVNINDLCKYILKSCFYYQSIEINFIKYTNDLNIIIDFIINYKNFNSISFCYCNILTNYNVHNIFKKYNIIYDLQICDHTFIYNDFLNFTEILYGNTILKNIYFEFYKLETDNLILLYAIRELIKKTYIENIYINYKCTSLNVDKDMLKIDINNILLEYISLDNREIPINSNSKSASKR